MNPNIYYILKKRSLYVTDTANLLKSLQNRKNFYFIQLWFISRKSQYFIKKNEVINRMRLQIFQIFIRKQHKCLSWWLQITTEEWKICNTTTILGVTLPRFYTYIENPTVGFYVLHILNMHAKGKGRGRGRGK